MRFLYEAYSKIDMEVHSKRSHSLLYGYFHQRYRLKLSGPPATFGITPTPSGYRPCNAA